MAKRPNAPSWRNARDAALILCEKRDGSLLDRLEALVIVRSNDHDPVPVRPAWPYLDLDRVTVLQLSLAVLDPTS